jgi:hypothetical protein
VSKYFRISSCLAMHQKVFCRIWMSCAAAVFWLSIYIYLTCLDCFLTINITFISSNHKTMRFQSMSSRSLRSSKKSKFTPMDQTRKHRLGISMSFSAPKDLNYAHMSRETAATTTMSTYFSFLFWEETFKSCVGSTSCPELKPRETSHNMFRDPACLYIYLLNSLIYLLIFSTATIPKQPWTVFMSFLPPAQYQRKPSMFRVAPAPKYQDLLSLAL